MLQDEKTKRIEFGSRAQASRKEKGDGKPETFTGEAKEEVTPGKNSMNCLNIVH